MSLAVIHRAGGCVGIVRISWRDRQSVELINPDVGGQDDVCRGVRGGRQQRIGMAVKREGEGARSATDLAQGDNAGAPRSGPRWRIHSLAAGVGRRILKQEQLARSRHRKFQRVGMVGGQDYLIAVGIRSVLQSNVEDLLRAGLVVVEERQSLSFAEKITGGDGSGEIIGGAAIVIDTFYRAARRQGFR